MREEKLEHTPQKSEVPNFTNGSEGLVLDKINQYHGFGANNAIVRRKKNIRDVLWNSRQIMYFSNWDITISAENLSRANNTCICVGVCV